MEKIRVLIADDSVIFRAHIRAALVEMGWIEVLGAVKNGRVAVERLAMGDVDLLILDLEMPEMDGLAALREIRAKNIKAKILVFSSGSKKSAANAIEALKLGAADFIAKPGPGPEAESDLPAQKIRQLIEPRLKALFEQSPKSTTPTPPERPTPAQTQLWDLFKPDIILIGSSTGGPSALEEIFAQLSQPLRCPILIVQHMPPVFTAALAERLQKLSGIPCREATNGDRLENKIYIAPGDYHMTLTRTVSQTRIVLDQNAQIHSVRPAVDPLFISAAELYRGKCLGIVLTGMGSDGRDGALHVKHLGGRTVIQDEASCIVFGMPGAVQAAGAADRVMNLLQIARLLNEKATLDTTSGGRVGA